MLCLLPILTRALYVKRQKNVSGNKDKRLACQFLHLMTSFVASWFAKPLED